MGSMQDVQEFKRSGMWASQALQALQASQACRMQIDPNLGKGAPGRGREIDRWRHGENGPRV